MSRENNLTSLTNGLILGAGIGLLSGIYSTLWYQKKQYLRADHILNNVKSAFLKEGPIEGSWIEFEKKNLRKFAVQSKAYTGGISRIEDHQLIHYEFIADAYTGTIIDIVRTTSTPTNKQLLIS